MQSSGAVCHLQPNGRTAMLLQQRSRTGIATAGRGVDQRRACGRRCLAVKASLVIVGDIGGTNARLSLWQSSSASENKELFAKTYPTIDHASFDLVMSEFLSESKSSSDTLPESAALAIAGAVSNNRCAMTNLNWVVDGDELTSKFGFRVGLLNDFEAVGYGIPALCKEDVFTLNDQPQLPEAPKVVMGPGTGLGAAQLMWDSGKKDYVVWPGEGSHATFAPRGWKQQALAAYATQKLGGHLEVEQVACGSGLELIYEFLTTDWQGVAAHKMTAPDISKAALEGSDPAAVEATDMLMAIVGAEAGAMALRCLAKGGVYIAGGITPRLLPHLLATPTPELPPLNAKGGALLEGFLCRPVREPFRSLLASIPLYVITNDKVGQIGAREYARKMITKSF